MAVLEIPEFTYRRRYDSKNNRLFINNVKTVIHCHHYAVLYTQLALDAVDYDGVRHLQEAAESTFYDLLAGYYTKQNVETAGDKIQIAEDYWQFAGMGRIRFTGVGKYEGRAEMDYSHIDEGWLKKWGGAETPVNFIACGFMAAVVALANEKPARSYRVTETQSLAAGDKASVFIAVLAV
jgi:hypothetical protein